MYQLPACVGNWSVISPCPFLPPWAFCCISSSLPAKEGSTEGFWGHLVSIWGNAPPWDWYMTKKDRIPLNEIFSEETTAIFNYPSCRYAQEIKLLKLWTWLFFHWRKKGSFQVCLKKNKLQTPQTRDVLSQLSLPASVFTANLQTAQNRFYKGMKTQSGPSQEPRQRSEHMEFTLSPAKVQLTQLTAHGPALPLQMVQGCSTQSWVTLSSWQSDDDKLPDSKAGTANTTEYRQREQNKAAQTLSQTPKAATVMQGF